MLSKTAECRAAIGAGDYVTADRLLAELREEVDHAWEAAAPEERSSIATEVLELLKWSRQATIVRRSHTQKRLFEMTRRRAYLESVQLQG